MTHKSHHIAWKTPQEIHKPRIYAVVLSPYRADSLNQKFGQFVAVVHPKYHTSPKGLDAHASLRMCLTLLGLTHLLICSLLWGRRHVPKECANFYKIYSTQ